MADVYQVTMYARTNADLRESFDLSPADLTGATFTMVVKDCAGTVMATLTVGSGITVSVPDSQLDIAILASVLTTWDPGQYGHELRMFQGAVTQTIFFGLIELVEGLG